MLNIVGYVLFALSIMFHKIFNQIERVSKNKQAFLIYKSFNFVLVVVFTFNHSIVFDKAIGNEMWFGVVRVY